MLGLMSRGYLCPLPPRVLSPGGPSIISGVEYAPVLGGVQAAVLVPSGTGGGTLVPAVDGVLSSSPPSQPSGSGGELIPSIVSAKEE